MQASKREPSSTQICAPSPPLVQVQRVWAPGTHTAPTPPLPPPPPLAPGLLLVPPQPTAESINAPTNHDPRDEATTTTTTYPAPSPTKYRKTRGQNRSDRNL